MPPLFIDERGKQNLKSIIFLHASGSSSQMWRHHVAVLEQDFHCILVDLPGHGASHNIEWTNFDDVVEMIVAIINSKAHGKPHLVGLSLGGSLILKLLEKHSSLIDRVIVDGASPQPIKGYRKIIAIVYLMSFLKNTKFVANLLTQLMQEVGKKPKPFMTGTAGWQIKMLGLNAPIILTRVMLGFLAMWIRIFSY